MIALLLLASFQTPTLTDQVSGTTARLQAVSPASEAVVWASGARGTVVRTLDGGANWTAMVVPGADSLEFRDIHALSADLAWAMTAGPGTASRIYRTTDGGKRWVLQWTNQEPRAFFDCLSFWDERRGIAISDAVDGVFVLMMTDDGETWRRVPAESSPPAREGEGLFAASGTCLVTRGTHQAWFGAGVNAGRVGRTTDGGRSWSLVNTPILQSTGTAGLTSLVFFDDRIGLGVGGDVAAPDSLRDRVVLTEDGGATWRLGGDLPFGGAAFGAAMVGGRTAVAVGPKGSAWTSDGGKSWAALDTRDYWSIGFSGNAGWMVGPRGRITKVEFAK